MTVVEGRGELRCAADELRLSVRALADIEESLGVLGAVLKTSVDALVVGDGTRWHRVSHSLARWLELDREKLQRTPWEVLVHPDDVAATLDAGLEVLRTGQPAELENRYRHAAGGWVRILWRWGPPDLATSVTVAIGRHRGRCE